MKIKSKMKNALLALALTSTCCQCLASSPSTLNSSPSTLNSKLSTLNSSPSTLNYTPPTLNSKLSTLNSQLSTPDSQLSTLNSKLSTPNSQLSTPESQLSILNSKLSTLNSTPPTLNSKLSTLNSFQVVALVDSLDFAKYYDIESITGTVQVLEHVLLTHANDVWWRDKGGGKMRYPSPCEAWPISEAPFDKRRLPSEDIYGHLRLDAPWAHVFPVVREECARRGVGFGIHTTLEENHGLSSLSSNWTLDHPQFWSCARGEEPWMGCCSIAYPEVVAHKMTMLGERLALKPRRILLDLARNGSWSYAREYSVQMVADWKRLNGDESEPEASDPRWIRHVDRHFCNYLRKFSARCHAAGVEFIVGMTDIDGRDDAKFKKLLGGFDWKPLAAEGVFDAIWIMSIPMDTARPFESTARIYRDIMAVRGRAKVYFPLPAYHYAKTSIYDYAKFAKISNGEATKRLLELARDAGGCGVVMECVDYRNYTTEVCAAIGEFLKGTCTCQ